MPSGGLGAAPASRSPRCASVVLNPFFCAMKLFSSSTSERFLQAQLSGGVGAGCPDLGYAGQGATAAVFRPAEGWQLAALRLLQGARRVAGCAAAARRQPGKPRPRTPVC